jgi:hypothetical protein
MRPAATRKIIGNLEPELAVTLPQPALFERLDVATDTISTHDRGRNHKPRRGVSIHVRYILYVATLLLALFVGVAAGAAWRDDDGGAESADTRLENGSGVQGVGHFEQNGERLTGFVALWGLEPNSDHAVHFHGPDSRCGMKADPVAAHPDLKADETGVAFTNVDLRVERNLLRGGFYYNVHEGPSRLADNPEIACGDLSPRSARAAP